MAFTNNHSGLMSTESLSRTFRKRLVVNFCGEERRTWRRENHSPAIQTHSSRTIVPEGLCRALMPIQWILCPGFEQESLSCLAMRRQKGQELLALSSLSGLQFGLYCLPTPRYSNMFLLLLMISLLLIRQNRTNCRTITSSTLSPQL